MRLLSLPMKPIFAPLRSRNVLIVAGLITLVYSSFQSLVLNSKLIQETLLASFPISYKLHLIFSLTMGYFYMFPLKELLFSLLTALLVGINAALVIALMQTMRRSGNVKFSVGGVGVLALASTGCPSCGLTLLSLLGPSTGVVAVALHNQIAQYVILGTLVLSIMYSLKRLQSSMVCKLPLKKSR